MVQARWGEQILDEVFTNLTTNRPDLDQRRLARTRHLMNEAIRDVTVAGYEPLIDQLDLPDHDDRHVLAAAIHARAGAIVTANLSDFPETCLASWGVVAVGPDAFVQSLIAADADRVQTVLARIAASWRNPAGTVEDVLAHLDRDGLTLATTALRARRPDRQ